MNQKPKRFSLIRLRCLRVVFKQEHASARKGASRRINHVANDDVECSRPVELAETQNRLFLVGLRLELRCDNTHLTGLGAAKRYSRRIRRIQRVQIVTIVWMSVEAVVALLRGMAGKESRAARLRWRQCHRILLGGSSAVEISCNAAHGDVEKRAARVAGALLFALAAYVAITSVVSLLGYSEPKPTLLGIAVLVAAAVVMPWLAKEKRRMSGATGRALEGGRRSVSAVCLPIADRIGGIGDQRDLAG